MTIWLIRAGSHGEYELKFIQENRLYVTWDDLDLDLAKLSQRAELTDRMTQRYPDTKPKAIANWVSSSSLAGRTHSSSGYDCGRRRNSSKRCSSTTTTSTMT